MADKERGIGKTPKIIQVASEAVLSQVAQRPERREFAIKALTAYANLLSGNSDTLSKTFAVSSNFQEYIKSQAQKTEIGPYFLELLDIVGNGELLQYQHKGILDVFAEMDNNYFWFQESLLSQGPPTTVIRKGDRETIRKVAAFVADSLLSGGDQPVSDAVTKAFDNFTAANNILLSGVRDTEKPDWRQFCQAAFSHLYKAISFNHQPNRYSGLEYVERMRDLFPGVKPQDWGFLIEYVSLTSDINFIDLKKAFDDKVRNGELEEAKACVNFAIEAFFKRKDANDFMQFEKEFTWIVVLRDFANGKLSIDRLRNTPVIWNRLRQAYFSLPEKLQEVVRSWSEGEKGKDKDGRRIIEVSLWNSIMQSPLLYEHTDTIVQLVSNGIPPSRKWIQALNQKPDILETLSVFNKGLAVLGEIGLNISFIHSMASELVLDNRAEAKDLPAVLTAAQKIHEQKLRMHEKAGLSEKAREVVDYQINIFYSSLDTLKNADAIAALLSRGYYPSPNLIRFFQDSGETAFEELERLSTQTRFGNFDPANIIQRDLEYLPYLEISTTAGLSNKAFTDFEKLIFRSTEKEIIELNRQERLEAEAAAYEAAKLYWFIRDRVASGRKLAVIGNERYGAYFVAEPLRPYLEELGVAVLTYYVRSGTNDKQELKKISKAIRAYLNREKPDDMVIVDGSADSFLEDTPRLPRSMEHYREMLETETGGKERYKVAYWVPVPGKEMVIGNRPKQPYVSPSDQRPQVILANPVIVPKRFDNFPYQFKEHNPGYLDDPNKYAKRTEEIVMTKTGVKKFTQGRTEREFVDLVQGHMMAVLPRYIRDTDPQNAL